jgi:acetyl esterase/lipase
MSDSLGSAGVRGSRLPSELGPFFDELSEWAGSVPVDETVRYGDDESNEIDLRFPASDSPHPVAFVLHGGFWRAPFTRKNTSAVCAALTQAGWATANVEYRRLGPGRYREMLGDVAAARASLQDTRLDLDRVTAIGHSAGGHLALWLASRGGANAVVGLAAVCDLRDAAEKELGDNAVQEFLGDDDSAYDEADPAARLPLGVPQILAHGTADDRVPYEHGRRYVQRAGVAGDDCTLLTLEGVDHFDVIDPRTDAWEQIAAVVPR